MVKLGSPQVTWSSLPRGYASNNTHMNAKFGLQVATVMNFVGNNFWSHVTIFLASALFSQTDPNFWVKYDLPIEMVTIFDPAMMRGSLTARFVAIVNLRSEK